MPASSKTNLPLGRAKPISDGGSASGIKIKKGKTCITAIAGGDWSDTM